MFLFLGLFGFFLFGFFWSLFLLALTPSCQQWAIGNMTGSQGVGWLRMLVWCAEILPVPFSANIQGVQLGEHFVVTDKKSINFLFFYNFQSSFCGIVCNVLWLSFIHFLFFGAGHRDTPLYKKQTGPRSNPNSWFAPPMSIGAMSTIGRREVFCVLYSKTVLPHRSVCFCGCW